MTIWRITPTSSLDLSPGAEPQILGILNVTPDSFSDGGRWSALDAAVAQAERMLAAGAFGVDIGGESTRPGAQRIRADEQTRRVVPVIEAVRRVVGPNATISIDTTRAEVARAALDAGADAINDVSGGEEDPAMLPLAAARACGIILMHRGTSPELDSYSTSYGKPGERTPPHGTAIDIVVLVKHRLEQMAARAVAAGIAWESIVLDPGLGFGKTVEQNLELVRRTEELVALGRPVMSGLSRKSFAARAAGLPDETPPAQRIDATVALSQGHREAGARLFRVHDVKEHAAAFGIGPTAGSKGRTPN
ncbi:MAG: dihydropteroate synthase [Phycisphaerales bacterium]|nr:dihydropteroate synthase [Phycisphaerales bacterium]